MRLSVVYLGSCLVAMSLLACTGGGETDDDGESAQAEWVAVASPAESPPASEAMALAYDEDRGVVVMHGGLVDGTAVDDTWLWDGSTWTEVGDAGGPERSAHAMAWDPISRRVILFDGAFAGDTWAWDGATWTELSPQTSPPARSYPGLATDRARERIVLFGGTSPTGVASDTWEWDGENWIERTPMTQAPGRSGFAFAYDDAREELVASGGQNLAYEFDTWTFDGETWTDRSDSGEAIASPRQGVAASYHADLGGVVMYGGLSNFTGNTEQDTRLWRGEGWVELLPTDNPGPLSYHAMVWDPNGGGVLLVGESGTWLLTAE